MARGISSIVTAAVVAGAIEWMRSQFGVWERIWNLASYSGSKSISCRFNVRLGIRRPLKTLTDHTVTCDLRSAHSSDKLRSLACGELRRRRALELQHR
jgi:hypothetical protein